MPQLQGDADATGLGAHAFLQMHSSVLSLHKGGNLEIADTILLLAFPVLAACFFPTGFFFLAGADLVVIVLLSALPGRAEL